MSLCDKTYPDPQLRRGADNRAVTLLWVSAATGRLTRPSDLPSRWEHIECSGDCLARLSHVHQPRVIVIELSGESRDLSNLRSVVGRYQSAVIFAVPRVTTELALWALRERAWDVLELPLDPEALRLSVVRLLNANRRQDRLIGRSSGRANELPHQLQGTDIPATYPAVKYVEEHFSDEIDTATAASLCGLSLSHFCRTFRKEHGLSFGDFVVFHRIAVSKKLLHGSQRTVTQVAHAVGFSDHSYFSKVFRRIVGISPSLYQAAPQHA